MIILFYFWHIAHEFSRTSGLMWKISKLIHFHFTDNKYQMISLNQCLKSSRINSAIHCFTEIKKIPNLRVWVFLFKVAIFFFFNSNMCLNADRYIYKGKPPTEKSIRWNFLHWMNKWKKKTTLSRHFKKKKDFSRIVLILIMDHLRFSSWTEKVI